MYIPRLQEKNVSLDSTHIMVSPDTYIIGSIFFTVCILLEGVRKLKFRKLNTYKSKKTRKPL